MNYPMGPMISMVSVLLEMFANRNSSVDVVNIFVAFLLDLSNKLSFVARKVAAIIPIYVFNHCFIWNVP